MADLVRTLFGGFAEPVPATAPQTLRTAFVFWRISLVLLPVYLFVAGLFAKIAGEDMRQQAEAMANDPLLVFFTLGIVLVFAFFLFVFAGIFIALGWSMWVLMPVLFIVFTWWLGTVLRGPSRGYAAVTVTALVVVVAGLMGGTATTYGVEQVIGLSPELSSLLFLGLLMPLLAFVFMLVPSSRRWLDARRAPPQPPLGWVRVEPQRR